MTTTADQRLTALLLEVSVTRAALRDLLDRRLVHPYLVRDAREESRAALELFVAELTLRSLPVPRKIHAELELLRRLGRAH